jgi:hypothetical protein
MKILLPLAILLGCNIDLGAGEAIGYVTYVEVSGVFWETPAVGFKSDTESSHTNEFCAPQNTALLDKLRSFARSRQLVRLTYRSVWAPWSWRCEMTGHGVIVTGGSLATKAP